MTHHQEIIDYLASAPDAPADLTRAIQQWLADHGGEAATTGALRSLWERTAPDGDMPAPVDAATAQGLQRLLHAIDAGGRAAPAGQPQAIPAPPAAATTATTPAPGGVRRMRPAAWLFVAASLCALLTTVAYLLGSRNAAPAAAPPSGVSTTTLLAAEGSIGKYTLPDGTNLWLNGGSSLTYTDDFDSAHERRVAIDGEAYFEVAHNPDRPFIVEMESMDLRVLGTSFIARSCSYITTDEVVLLSGKVEVESPLLPEKVTMRPDQRMAVDRQSHDAVVEPTDARAYTRWIQPVTTFDNAPLSDLLIHLSRRYGLATEVSPTARTDQRLSITLNASQPLDEVIEIIEHILPVRMNVEGRQLTVAAASPKTAIH